jgi:hypothetical protein
VPSRRNPASDVHALSTVCCRWPVDNRCTTAAREHARSMWQPRHSVRTPPMVLFCAGYGGFRMRKTIATVTLSLALISSAAMAQERTGDAALGALSGALVLGPVGAVAGALVGYAAGPSIASAWGLRRSSSPRRSTTAEPAPNASASSPAQRRQAYAAMPAAAPPPSVQSSGSAPPVQPLE